MDLGFAFAFCCQNLIVLLADWLDFFRAWLLNNNLKTVGVRLVPIFVSKYLYDVIHNLAM